MKPIGTFDVVPSLPAPLERLDDLAHNLRWAWDHDTIELFRRLDDDLWERTGHNPALMLGTIDQERLEAAANDEGFMAHLERVTQDLEGYMDDTSTWFRRTHGTGESPLTAYFSAEFGLTDCLTIFAGGLGVLAGDHLKSASDLGIPLVGVGLLYQKGYFRQYLDAAGWQQEVYTDNDFQNLPLILERRSNGMPLSIDVPYPGGRVVAQVWRVQVGRVPLYLLDTNVSGNSCPESRDITDQLYGGGLETRIRQEIMLGVGGYRVLEALDLQPAVYHMNEGHSAFLVFERIRRLMETRDLSFAEAREAVSASLVFTTHTPVPAGHDYFSPDLMDRYFADYARAFGLSRREFLALGRQDPANTSESFRPTILALRLAAHSNGVSQLHDRVARHMWQGLWPGVPEEEVPIVHVTNGVHFRSWISLEMNQLYDRYLGPRWREEPADKAIWQRAERIAAEELWRTHERRRERLVFFSRRRLRNQLERRGASRAEIEAADEVLDPEALTIGFARRFATYKRATLVLRDPERLARIVNDPERPVQIIFSGKAHPQDEAGKELIRQIVRMARQERFRRRLVFLEDYDMAAARYLVQGADVWLNTPRRTREASGTSGMKAAANCALNLSTLDGWWDEAYRPEVGWAIGRGEVYEDYEEQDEVEARALYDLLERDVVPRFYDRGADRVPSRWIAHMQTCIGNLCPFVNAHRMVREYTERFYLPTADRYRQFMGDGAARAKAFAAWKAHVQEDWSHLRVETVEAEPLTELQVGGTVRARARVYLSSLTPEDVEVELLVGRVDADGDIVEVENTPMRAVKSTGKNSYVFEGSATPCRKSGLHGYTVRMLPRHPDLHNAFLPGLIVWAASDVQAE
ncbi:MAG: alpha-glucan family phosphorylase [Anaerolineae bacterium]